MMWAIYHGEEEFARSEAVAKLKAPFVSAGLGDLNVVTLDGRKASVEEVIAISNTMPFLSDKRLVIVRDLLARFEPRGEAAPAEGEAAAPPQRARDQADKLIAYLPQVPPSTQLLFLESKTLARNNAVLKAAQQAQPDAVREFRPLAEEELTAWVTQRAKGKGPGIQPRAASALIAAVGHDLRALEQELDKLAALVNYARPIGEGEVKALVPAGHEADIFALVDALGARNRLAAMRHLHQLLQSGANELYLLTMVARQVRLILAAKDLAETQKLRAEEVRRELRLSHSFVAEKLLRQAKMFTMPELEALQRRVLEYDARIKTGRIAGPLALEMLVMESGQR